MMQSDSRRDYNHCGSRKGMDLTAYYVLDRVGDIRSKDDINVGNPSVSLL